MRLAKKVPRAVLEATCDICRACHNAVHRAESNTTLAARFNTLELLREHEAVARWVKYALGTARLTSWDMQMMRNHARK